MNFEECVSIILDHEGGYVDSPNDPGGETKYGISKRAYPHLPIADLTVADARMIYKKDYWDKIEGDRIPDYMRLLVFDCAVNQGTSRAIKFMQRSCGAGADGVIGPNTMSCLYNINVEIFLRNFCMLRHKSYTSLDGWKHYGAGWSGRLLDVLLTTMSFLQNNP